MKFWNTIRKIERIRFYLSLIAVGVLFTVVSCIVIAMPKPEFSSADGVIQRIEPYNNPSGEELYVVYVSYTDESGNRHEEIRYPAYSSSMKEGDTVTVLYDPAAPEEIQAPGGEIVPYVLFVVGVIAIVAAVWMIAKGAKKSESDSPFEDPAEKTFDPSLVAQIEQNDEPTREYYFHWTGKLNQSYILETPAREAVYEAICDHIGVLTPYRFTFADRRTGKTQEHKVSHTVTTRYGNGTDSLMFSVVSSSHFKIDDVENWRYLSGLGYSVEPEHRGIKLNFTVKHCGVPVAYLEAAGVNILKDNAKNPLGDKLPGQGLYKVSCKDSDVEAVFAACFCVSRVEFY